MFFTQKVNLTQDQNLLDNLFKELDFSTPKNQPLILLKIGKLSLKLKLPDATSYILQSLSLTSAYEPNLVLFYHAIYEQNSTMIEKYFNDITIIDAKELEVFSFEELNQFIKDISLSPIQKEYIKVIYNNYLEYKETNCIQGLSLSELISKYPKLAIKQINKIKKTSHLEERYPKLNQLSIRDWEKEFPDIKEYIKEKEILLNTSTPFDINDFIDLGKAYFLQNQFEDAAKCFKKAKTLFTRQTQ